jgi:anti-sigma-K factor RskA
VTCEELKALAPAWALGALEEEERLALEAHLASPRPHEGCESALARADQAAQLLIQGLEPVVPPEAVWNEIESQLVKETDSAVRRASALPRWSRFSRTLALAASVAVVFLLIGNRYGREEAGKVTAVLKEAQARVASDLSLAQTARTHVEGQFEACRRDLKAADDSLAERQRALSLLAEPTTEVVELAPQPNFNASGRVILNRAKRQAIVFANSLSPIADRDYELWIIRDGNKFPAGLLKLEAGGSALALIDDKLLRAGPSVFAITLEPAGGGPVPRGPVVLLGAVKKG